MVELTVDGEGSSSGIQERLHLIIEGPLKYRINSKRTYHDLVPGPVRVWTPVRMRLPIAAGAEVRVRIPGVVAGWQILGFAFHLDFI